MKFLVLSVTFAVAALGMAQESPPLFPGTGLHARDVGLERPEARRLFHQGLAFLFAFNHDEAIRSFQAASEIEPRNPMPYWAIAIANGPHINNPVVDADHAKAAWDALQLARAHIGQAKPVDQMLIRAAERRYAMPQPSNRSMLDRAYADAMRRVWRSSPQDPDVGALFAEAMMDLRPWDLWRPDGSPQPGTAEIVATLERVLRLNPRHPLGNHLYIHAVEASPHPEKGLPAADRLRELQPGLGHMVHMPSHIDVRVGAWDKAIEANRRAILVDAAYRAKSPDQNFYRVYMAHNHHMLAFAAMMNGQSKRAIEAMDGILTLFPAEWLEALAPLIDGFLAMPIEVRKRFGLWDDVLAYPEMGRSFPLARTMRHQARAVAYAAQNRLTEARAEQQAFYKARREIAPGATFGNNSASLLLSIAHHLMNGEILLAEGKLDASIRELRKAVESEDQVRYDEPPDWIQPTRHTLGVVLLKAGRPGEAERVYRADLQRLPSNGWSLFGLAQALAMQGKTKSSAATLRKFREVWRHADVQIGSSCLCVPKP
ncbi:MAG TPA: hypothetical protein PLH94_02410 [Fimbriimonadaceae bacterium]|nr:hypothetical protein [Fimbriimonadaceae bacterium]